MNLSQYLRHLYDVLPTYDPTGRTSVLFGDLKPGDILFCPHDFTWDAVTEVKHGDLPRLVTRRLAPGPARTKEANRKIYLGLPKATEIRDDRPRIFCKSRDVTADLSYFPEPVIRLLVDCEEGTCFRLLGDRFISKPQRLLTTEGRGYSMRVPEHPRSTPRLILDSQGVMETLKVEVLDINDFVS